MDAKLLLICMIVLSMCGIVSGSNITVPDFHNMGLISDPDILAENIEFYNTTPRLPNAMIMSVTDTGVPDRYSLLATIPYNAAERSQGFTGTCWVWASTAVLEGSHSIENGYPDRLSIQWFASRYNNGCCEYAGMGGTPGKFADFYNNLMIDGKHFALPWSNTNADWQDGPAELKGPTLVPADSISLNPHYNLTGHIVPSVIRTSTEESGSQAQSIANIKSILRQNRPVILAFFGNRENNFWNDFQPWFDSNPSTDIYDISDWPWWSINQTGHAVAVVGYYDDGTAVNSYWECLNSWGSTPGHPDGVFRLKMYMNYDNFIQNFWYAYGFDGGSSTKAFVQERPITQQFTVSGIRPNPLTGSTTLDFTALDWGYPTERTVDFGGYTRTFPDSTYPGTILENRTTEWSSYETFGPGTYWLRYNASNGAGHGDSVLLGPLTVDGYRPEALFSSWNPGYCPITEKSPRLQNFAVRFFDRSLFVPTGWTWNFGDGSPVSHEQNPTHEYANKGQYVVTLTAQNAYGSSTKSMTIDVQLITDCSEFFSWSDKHSEYVWTPWHTAGGPPWVEIDFLNNLIDRKVPLTFTVSKARGVQWIPAPSIGGAGFGERESSLENIGPLRITSLSKNRMNLPRGINKTMKAFVNTNHLKPGYYTFTVNARDPQSGRVIQRVPAYFQILALPRIKVNPEKIDLGTINIGSTKTGEISIKNKGNVPLNCVVKFPKEFIVKRGSGERTINLTIPAQDSKTVQFQIDTLFRAQQNIDRSKFSEIRIASNDPDNPEAMVPVLYTLIAPRAKLVSMDIPDWIENESSFTAHIMLENAGNIPWAKSSMLAIPPVGDAGLFVSRNAPSEYRVDPGYARIYQITIIPRPNLTSGEYTLVFEMAYPDADGNLVYFGNPVFKPVYYGTKEGSIEGYKQDSAGNGLSNWTISLVDKASGRTRTTATGASGMYRFGNVTFGTYWLNETPKSGWTQITPNTTVIVNATNPHAAYTFVNRITALEGTIEGCKRDSSGNGLINWTISLLDKVSGSTRTTVTGASGMYRFGNVTFGNYWLNETPRSGWHQITPNITITLNETNPSWTYTFTNEFLGEGTVEGYKNDISGARLYGWTISLIDPFTGEARTNTTTVAGKYIFNNVTFGTYWLNETPKSGWTQVKPNISVTLNATNPTESYVFVNMLG